MARAAGEPSAKRAKVDEAEEKEDPLVRRREELVLMDANARAKGREVEEGLVREAEEKAERLKREAEEKAQRLKREAEESLAQHMPSVCTELEAANRKLLGKLPPELWSKIVDENLDQNDLPALAMTCRFFRKKQKDLRWELVVTNLNPKCLLNLKMRGKEAPYSLGWFRWVCDTFKFRRDCDRWGFERNLVNCAALQGSVKLLRWLMEEKGWELNKETGFWAGMGGSVEILEHLRGKGYEFDEGACYGAARGGHLEALKFLRGLDPPCPWRAGTCEQAALGGHLEVLKFARGQDPPCPWNRRTCFNAAQGGHLDVLQFLRSQDPPCPWDEHTCFYAAREGHLDVLKWLRDQDPPCPWDGRLMKWAVERGHLEALKFLRGLDPPCPWDEGTCSSAAEGGNLEILKWLRDQDPPCPWNEWTCARAAQGGHLDVLKFLRSQDPPCPWSRRLCKAALSRKSHIVQWIDQQEDESDVELSDPRLVALRDASISRL